MLSDLNGWDYAVAMNLQRINEGLMGLGATSFDSVGSKATLSGDVLILGIGPPFEGDSVTLYVQLQSGKLVIPSHNNLTFDATGTIVQFAVPVNELAPHPGEGGDTSIGLSFSHKGIGKGDTEKVVVTPNRAMKGKLSAVVLAEIGILVINGLRGDPARERLILARLLSHTGKGHLKPQHWHWYVAESSNKKTHFLVLMVTARRSSTKGLPKTIDADILPHTHGSLEIVARDLFWSDVIVPALSKGMGGAPDSVALLPFPVPAKPGMVFWMGKATWKKPKNLVQVFGKDVITDVEIYWADTFAVNFNYQLPTHSVLDLLGSSVGMNVGFRMTFDPATGTLKTRKTHKGNATGKNKGAPALIAAISPGVYTKLAQDIAGVIPVVHLAEFTRIGPWMARWPHLAQAEYRDAELETASDIHFTFD